LKWGGRGKRVGQIPIVLHTCPTLHTQKKNAEKRAEKKKGRKGYPARTERGVNRCFVM